MVTVSLLIACQKVEDPVSTKQHAKVLLNNSQFEEAIVVLKKEHKANPSDDEITLLLASAYAGSLKLDFVSLSDAIFDVLAQNRYTPKSNTSLYLEGDQQEEEDKVTQLKLSMLGFLEAVELLMAAASAFPVIDGVGQRRLAEASVLLAKVKIGSPYSTRALLFSGFLKSVRVINLIKDTMPSDFINEGDYQVYNMACAIQIRDFVNSVEEIVDITRSIADDLGKVEQTEAEVKFSGLDHLAAKAADIKRAVRRHKSDFSKVDLIAKFSQAIGCD